MGNANSCTKRSLEVYDEFSRSPRVSNLALKINSHPGNCWAFRAEFTKRITDATGNIVSGISISIPPDAMGNRGPNAPYHEPDIPQTIETALVGVDGRLVYADDLGYEDIQRFSNINELIDHLESFLNNGSR